jgi:acetylornithine deacetylase/succinyl-diaminopimelate desuccinylase-like protein
MSWITDAQVSKLADRIAVEITNQKEQIRIENISSEKETAGLKNVTVEQAYAFIDSRIDSATTVAQVKAAVKDILKRMVPYIID